MGCGMKRLGNQLWMIFLRRIILTLLFRIHLTSKYTQQMRINTTTDSYTSMVHHTRQWISKKVDFF